jgi:hypothetical protein
MVIVANFSNCSVEERQVPASECKELSTTFECPFFETDGSDPGNKATTEAFLEVIRESFLLFKVHSFVCALTILVTDYT